MCSPCFSRKVPVALPRPTDHGFDHGFGCGFCHGVGHGSDHGFDCFLFFLVFVLCFCSVSVSAFQVSVFILRYVGKGTGAHHMFQGDGFNLDVEEPDEVGAPKRFDTRSVSTLVQRANGHHVPLDKVLCQDSELLGAVHCLDTAPEKRVPEN